MAETASRAAWGSRIAVWLVIMVLAAAFIAETAVMIWEFREPLALPMAAFDSQLFLFFPTLGIIGMLAFSRAAIVIVDAYWRHVPFGKLILIACLLIAGAISAYLTVTFKNSANRQWWEVAKPTLLADPGEPANCQPPNCERAPIVEAYASVRAAARSEAGLAGLTDSCEDENMSVFRPQEERINFCFATGSPETVSDCCAAKQRFKTAVSELHAESPSLMYEVHHIILPAKVFFLLSLLGIGLMLARRRKVLEANYPRAMVQVERTMPIGGISMLLWPLMNQAYTQSFDLLYGAGDVGAFRVTAPLYTLAFGGWAMILLFYYFRRYPAQTEGAAKVMGALAAGLSILNFDTILAWVNKFVGAGANVVSISVLGVITLFLAYEAIFHPGDGEDAPGKEPIPQRND